MMSHEFSWAAEAVVCYITRLVVVEGHGELKAETLYTADFFFVFMNFVAAALSTVDLGCGHLNSAYTCILELEKTQTAACELCFAHIFASSCLV